MNRNSWIGFDLDGTLAEYHGWSKDGSIGRPIWPMVNMLKAFLTKGVKCKIFTARVCGFRNVEERDVMIRRIQDWCQAYVGQILEITHEKDWAMIAMFDDRCFTVEKNNGKWFTYMSTDELEALGVTHVE